MAASALTTKTELSLGAALADAAALPGSDVPWVAALREQAGAAFTARGLPHRRIEEWKYTDLKNALSAEYRPAQPSKGALIRDGLTEDPFAGLDAHVLVFVNGWLRADLSKTDDLPAGVSVTAMADALNTGHEALQGRMGSILPLDASGVTALNTGLMADGALIVFDEGTALDKPLLLSFVTTETGTAAHARVMVVAGPGSRGVILESHTGAPKGDHFVSVGMEWDVADGAELSHYKLQGGGAEAAHAAGIGVRLGQGARYEGVYLTSGGALTRNDVRVRFTGPESFARVSGASMLSADQHADNTTLIEHAAPDCACREVFKTVLAGSSRGVFQGKILVQQQGQRTDGYQMAQSLLLSAQAEADTKPELEIYADDVKCSHGATTGELDDEALFYLMSRGISPAEGKALLVGAFLREVLDEIHHEAAREALDAHIGAWLSAHAGEIGTAPVGEGAKVRLDTHDWGEER